jgi:hypothetical protein
MLWGRVPLDKLNECVLMIQPHLHSDRNIMIFLDYGGLYTAGRWSDLAVKKRTQAGTSRLLNCAWNSGISVNTVHIHCADSRTSFPLHVNSALLHSAWNTESRWYMSGCCATYLFCLELCVCIKCSLHMTSPGLACLYKERWTWCQSKCIHVGTHASTKWQTDFFFD